MAAAQCCSQGVRFRLVECRRRTTPCFYGMNSRFSRTLDEGQPPLVGASMGPRTSRLAPSNWVLTPSNSPILAFPRRSARSGTACRPDPDLRRAVRRRSSARACRDGPAGIPSLQPGQVELELHVAPSGELAHVPPAEAQIGAGLLEPPAFLADPFVDERQQPPRLRGQFIQLRPSTSPAIWLAAAMSSSVTSM